MAKYWRTLQSLEHWNFLLNHTCLFNPTPTHGRLDVRFQEKQPMLDSKSSNLQIYTVQSAKHTHHLSPILSYTHHTITCRLSTVKWLYIPLATLAQLPTRTHTVTPHPFSNVVVIEGGTWGWTNRWAHMLLRRFIRLSGQHLGQAFLDTQFVYVCVSYPRIQDRWGADLLRLIPDHVQIQLH